jgi:hypothetical protein
MVGIIAIGDFEQCFGSLKVAGRQPKLICDTL